MSVHLAKGTRDHLPEKMNQRLHVIGILREVFERYGFEPLETPAFERIETLMGKYGDEGEQLIFKILKRGEGGKRGEVDQALRYDLTVPLARCGHEFSPANAVQALPNSAGLASRPSPTWALP